MNEYINLLDNIDKLHTTKMGIDRIKNNLNIESSSVIDYCKEKNIHTPVMDLVHRWGQQMIQYGHDNH